MTSKMYIEKSLEYTVKGIEILRNETIQLFQNRNNYLSFGTGAIALFFYSAATSQYNYPFLTYVVLLLAIPFLSCFLIIISLYINVQIVNLCRYLRSREMILTYLLESIYEDNQEFSNFGNNNNLTHTQERIKKLFFGKEIRDINFLDHQILRNQIPIYWEGYMLNPIRDKLKSIDLQSYMITWMFSVIALISYCTALIFRASVEKKCPKYDTNIIWQCETKISDLNFFNDIYFFRNHNFDFFKQYKEYPTLKNLTDFFNAQDDTNILNSMIFILTLAYFLFFLLRIELFTKLIQNFKNFILFFLLRIELFTKLIQNFKNFIKKYRQALIIICILLISIFISIFFVYKNYLLILFVILIYNIFGEHIIMRVRKLEEEKVTIKELTEHNPMPIIKDYYSLFLNLTSFLVFMYFLRFHTELSVFIIILSTFSYSIFWQIPQFRKTAYRPLNADIFIEEDYFD